MNIIYHNIIGFREPEVEPVFEERVTEHGGSGSEASYWRRPLCVIHGHDPHGAEILDGRPGPEDACAFSDGILNQGRSRAGSARDLVDRCRQSVLVVDLHRHPQLAAKTFLVAIAGQNQQFSQGYPGRPASALEADLQSALPSTSGCRIRLMSNSRKSFQNDATRWCPSSLAKLVNISTISLGLMNGGYIELVIGIINQQT